MLTNTTVGSWLCLRLYKGEGEGERTGEGRGGEGTSPTLISAAEFHITEKNLPKCRFNYVL